MLKKTINLLRTINQKRNEKVSAMEIVEFSSSIVRFFLILIFFTYKMTFNASIK